MNLMSAIGVPGDKHLVSPIGSLSGAVAYDRVLDCLEGGDVDGRDGHGATGGRALPHVSCPKYACPDREAETGRERRGRAEREPGRLGVVAKVRVCTGSDFPRADSWSLRVTRAPGPSLQHPAPTRLPRSQPPRRRSGLQSRPSSEPAQLSSPPHSPAFLDVAPKHVQHGRQGRSLRSRRWKPSLVCRVVLGFLQIHSIN